MSNGTLTVEIAFGAEPFLTSPSWTNVSAYVRRNPPVQIVRGRTSERSVFQAGTATLTLSNRDRRFDPTYAAGPHFGDLKPGVRIRISGGVSPDIEVLFEGFITGWPQDMVAIAKDATVTISAVDSLGWLNRARVPDDMITSEIYASAFAGPPDMMLRFTDDFDWIDYVNSAQNASLVFGTRTQGASLLPGSSSPSIVFDGGTMWQVKQPLTTVSTPNSAMFMMQTTQVPDTTGFFASSTVGIWGNSAKSGATHYGTSVGINGAGQLVWSYGPGGAGSGSLTTFQRVNDGKPHHIVLVNYRDPNISQIFIDGAQVQTIAAGDDLGWIGCSVIGNASPDNDVADNYIGGQFYAGSVQDLMIWEGIGVQPSEAKYFFDLANGFLIESVADRFDRILDAVGWPTGSAWRDEVITSGTCGRLVFNGRTALEMLQELERTEQGYLYASGKVVKLQGRYWHQPVSGFDYGYVSQATFSDDGAASAIKYTGAFGFRFDDLDIRNDISVLASPAGRGRAVDQTSGDAYGYQSLSLDTVLPSAQLAADMASGLLHRYTDPVWRSKQMVVYPARGAKWDPLVYLDLTQRITQEITPNGVGPQVAHDMLIGRIEWIIGDIFELSILGEPVPPRYFVLDSSALDGPDPLGF